MSTKFEDIKAKLAHKFIVPVIAVAAVLSFASYEIVKPIRAIAAAPAPAAAALDESSVSALLALDRAMEAVAARVTPAIVNVTVTSKVSAERGDAAEQDNGQDGNDQNDDEDNGPQQFFGPGFPFGKRFFQMRPQRLRAGVGGADDHGQGRRIRSDPFENFESSPLLHHQVCDDQVESSSLELLDTLVMNVCRGEVQPFQGSQTGYILHAFIGDIGGGE